MPNRLISRLIHAYGMPDLENPDAWLVEAEAQLVGMPDVVLDKAASAIIRTAKRFPSIAAMVDACNDVLGAEPKKPEKNKYPEWSKEARACADKLVVSEIGQQAAAEGWSLSLHDFCRVQRRLPNAYEVSRLKRQAHDFDEAFATAMSIKTILGEKLVVLGESMLARRNAIADLSNGILPE